MLGLEARILAYLRQWPSVGILRLAIDLGEDLNRVVECLARLQDVGLVEVKREPGVANFRPWLKKVGERQAAAVSVRPVEGPKAAVSILDFMGGGGGAR